MKYPKQKDQMELIGADVQFKRTLYPEYFKNGKRKWLRTSGKYAKLIRGKIVGFGCSYNGQYIPGNAGYFEDVCPAHFIANKRVPHIKVRTKGEGKSIKVAPIDCKIIK